MTDGPQDVPAAPASLADKRVGVLVTVGLVAGGLAGLAGVQLWFERRDTEVLRTIPDVLVTWREPADLFLPMMLVAIAPLILVPSVFGLNRAMPAFAPTVRWRMVALAAGAVVVGVGWGALTGRAEVGVATRFGAAWLYDGKPVEHWSWGAATSVGAGCTNQRDETSGKVAPTLNYDVAFPSGREANLARDIADARAVLAKLAPIDASLRARSVPRFTAADEGCVKRYEQGLSEAQQANFRSVLGR